MKAKESIQEHGWDDEALRINRLKKGIKQATMYSYGGKIHLVVGLLQTKPNSAKLGLLQKT